MKQNTTYKQTELGLIPEDWEVKKISKFTQTTAGGTPSTQKNEYWNGDIKWMNSGELNLKKVFNVENKITELGLKNSSTKLIPVKCILIGLAGQGKTRGTVAMNMVELCTNQSIAAIYPNDSFISEFLYYNLDNRYAELRRLSTGDGGRGGLNLKLINSLKIPLPPLPEQKKIADCLSTWDVAIEKQSALINALTDRKKALMQQLLTGKKRLPGFSGEWKEVKMGDLFEKINRKNEEGNTNVVTISAQRGFVKQTDFFNKSVASETLDNYSLIYHGEFCYNKSYSNGYPLGATKRLIAFEKAVVTTLYICFKIKDQKKSNGSFFEQFFEANSLDRSLIKIAQEGGRAHGLLNVSLSDFFNIKIKLPPIEEQTAIAEILAAADRELQLQKEKLAQLQAQKKGLMQVLLTGKKRLIN